MPVIAIDREGPIGFKVWQLIKSHFDVERDLRAFVLGERASDKAFRRPDLYDNHRDELWGALEAWLRDSGALLKDPKLEKELGEIEWTSNVRNRLKATPKDDIRKALGRSPDRGDALCLAVWEPTGYRVVAQHEREQAQPAAPPRIDPYRTIHTGSSAFDPYAGVR
jgi:hypothetical protein